MPMGKTFWAESFGMGVEQVRRRGSSRAVEAGRLVLG